MSLRSRMMLSFRLACNDGNSDACYNNNTRKNWERKWEFLWSSLGRERLNVHWMANVTFRINFSSVKCTPCYRFFHYKLYVLNIRRRGSFRRRSWLLRFSFLAVLLPLSLSLFCAIASIDLNEFDLIESSR